MALLEAFQAFRSGAAALRLLPHQLLQGFVLRLLRRGQSEDSQSVSQLRPAQGTVVGPASPGGIADTFQTTAGLPVPSGAEWPPCQAQLPGTLPALSAISANSANSTDSASSASDATLKERP